MYCIHEWGLRHLSKIVGAHMSSLKELLSLPKCTVNAALRLKLGIVSFEFKFFKASYIYVAKILSIDEIRLHSIRLCFMRQVKLMQRIQ